MDVSEGRGRKCGRVCEETLASGHVEAGEATSVDGGRVRTGVGVQHAGSRREDTVRPDMIAVARPGSARR